jgi:hypothetical protein
MGFDKRTHSPHPGEVLRRYVNSNLNYPVAPEELAVAMKARAPEPAVVVRVRKAEEESLHPAAQAAFPARGSQEAAE